MTVLRTPVRSVPVGRRIDALDRVRGLAILLMVGDHVALFAGVHWWRVTVGRLALPLFFVLAGYLLRRLTWRHAGIAAAGALLPLLVPWIDRPNVLLWYVAGSAVLLAADRLGLPSLVLAVPGLILGANGYGWHAGTYEPAALLGLLALGHALPAFGTVERLWGWAGRLPALYGHLGRYPISIYLGHVLALQCLAAGLSWTVNG